MKQNFEILIMPTAEKFLNKIGKDAERAVLKTFKVAQLTKDPKHFKKLSSSNGIWEFRTNFKGTQYRHLAFWDNDQRAMVVVTSGFIKKDQKTPKREIEKAQNLMKEYYSSSK